MTTYLLLHLDDEVLAGRPESLRVGDAEHILLIGIAQERIRAGGMGRQNLGRRAEEFDLLVDADINLREVALVVIGLKHLALHQNIV